MCAGACIQVCARVRACVGGGSGPSKEEPAKVAGGHQSLCRTAETQYKRWESLRPRETAKKFWVKRLLCQARTVFTEDSGPGELLGLLHPDSVGKVQS